MNPALPIKQISKYNKYGIINNYKRNIIKLMSKGRAG